MSRCHDVAVLAVLVATSAIGCTTGTGGAPDTSDTGSAPDTSDTPVTSGAPTVADPLDITRYLDDPCLSLTDRQVTEYLGDEAEPQVATEQSSGPSCSWYSGMRSHAQIVITYPRLTDEGMTAIYRNRDVHAFFHETAPVNGYPAVSYGGVDSREKGECLVTVGTSNSDYVNIDVYLGASSVGRVDPCDAAHEVATVVISNIQSA